MQGYRFTERVQLVLDLAQNAARSRRHGHISPEHILIGLLEDGGGVGFAVLQHLGADLLVLVAEADGALPPGYAVFADGERLPYTHSAKQVVAMAMTEASELQHSYLGTEHLLLGLLRDEEGSTARTLAAMNVTIDHVRRETQRLLGVDASASRSIGGAMPSITTAELKRSTTSESENPIVSVAIDVTFRDGGRVSRQFSSLADALQYLSDDAQDSTRPT